LLRDGSIEGKVSISGKGFYDLVLRSVAKQVPSFQLPMVWSQLGQNLATTIKIENLKAGDFADLAGPFEIAFDYRARDYTVDTGKLTMLKIPFSSQAFDLTSVSLFQILAAREERKYPISLPSTLGCREEEVITIPPGYRIRAIPDAIHAREGPVSLILTVSTEGDKIFFSSDFRIEAPTLGPEEYQGLRKVVKGLRRFQKAMIILEKAEGEGKGGRP